MISLASTVSAVKEQVSCGLGDEAVLLHLGTSSYFGLNEVGTSIWNLVQEPRTVQEIIDHITQKYVVGLADCERDVLEVLHQMYAAGFIEVHDAEAQ